MDNLHIYLRRGRLHAPNHSPNDGLLYRTNHNADIQATRHSTPIPRGPRGVIHDYIPFYFGYLSPMLLQLKTGQVPGYTEGQAPLIYLVTTAQAVRDSGQGFVFSDGHGIAAYTQWFDDLAELDKIDWKTVYERYWADTLNDMDRQRRKQAEFLVHRFCDWSLIREIGVIDKAMQDRTEAILAEHHATQDGLVRIRRDWYYH